MLVSTPSMRNSASAREVRAMASAKAPRFAAKAPSAALLDGECPITLASSESKLRLVS